jgi:predicted RNase H-like HicB family nuclease
MRRIQVVIYREDEFWVAQALNVECSSFGKTPDEARDAVREALQLLLDDDGGLEIQENTEARLEELVV